MPDWINWWGQANHAYSFWNFMVFFLTFYFLMDIWEHPFSLDFFLLHLYKLFGILFSAPLRSGTNTFHWVPMFHSNVVTCIKLNKNLSSFSLGYNWTNCVINAISEGVYLRIHFIQSNMTSPQSRLRTLMPRSLGCCTLVSVVVHCPSITGSKKVTDMQRKEGGICPHLQVHIWNQVQINLF